MWFVGDEVFEYVDLVYGGGYDLVGFLLLVVGG